MDAEKSLVKITTKYHCMVTGKSQMEPCEGCSNPKGCLSRAMQYKENEEMDELNEKAIVKIDADGGVVKCAKGLDAGECGFKAGAKVCGACGAMPVMQKQDDVESDLDEKADMKPMVADGEDEEMSDAEDMNEEDDEEMEKGWMMKPGKDSRRRAVSSMGMKSADDDAFICQLERKVYPGVSELCVGCTGGCKSEEGMPGLLDVEGTVLGMVGGKVLDSGYLFEEDQFIVQVQAKSGKVYEFFADGDSGEVWSMERLDDPEYGMSEKSIETGENGLSIIGPDEAVDIALKSLMSEFDVTGEVVAAESEIFLGHDVYAVEIDAVDGKSYDVYVTLDGQFVGVDEWSAEEAEEIEAEAAEIALKRAYSEESRTEMADRGFALPDGSYPIKDVADLQNAIRAYGRAKDKPAARAHIMKRARALGAENMIPANWAEKAVDWNVDEVVAVESEVELKRMYAEDDRKKMAESGEAMEDGSFPIKDTTDLRNAIQAYGRAKDKEAAKAHIIKRAMALKAEDMIPMDWVPQDIQDKFKKGEKSEDAEFLASLMEFELLTQEHDFKNF